MKPLFIAGPCVIESADVLDVVATEIGRLQQLFGLDIYFKASFDKANRTSLSSYRGPGMEKGLQMLADVRERGLDAIEEYLGEKISRDFFED